VNDFGYDRSNGPDCYEQILVLRWQGRRPTPRFTELVERYSPRCAITSGRCSISREALTMSSRRFGWTCFRGLPKLADTLAFPAWIYRVARNRCALVWRKRDRADRLAMELQTLGRVR
jgi:RNA polymerase sigma-70 factor (ECF subfamily)